MDNTPTAYPLTWPAGWKRTPDGAVLIPLTRGMHAIVDEADAPTMVGSSWHAHRARSTWYARTEIYQSGSRTVIYMQRLVLPNARLVDHRDLNGLNNRRSNLREASNALNIANAAARRQGYKGVSWHAARKKWIAGITFNRRRINADRFATEEEAALAYDKLALRYFGAFARLNFPSEQSSEANSISILPMAAHPDAGGSHAAAAALNEAISQARMHLK